MTRPQEWLLAIRNHPDRPDRARCHVLTMLTLRLNWKTGRGFASVPELMADAGVSRSTVERALGWARGKGPARDRRFFLVQTKRGHRQGDGIKKSSEWQTRLPGDPSYVPPPRKAPVRVSPDTKRTGLYVSDGASLCVTRDPPSRPSPSRPSLVADVGKNPTGSSGARPPSRAAPVAEGGTGAHARDRAALNELAPEDHPRDEPSTPEGTERIRQREHDRLNEWMRLHPGQGPDP